MLALILRMVASLAVVLAVMGLIARVLRRSGAPAAMRRGAGGGIQVLARRGLSRTSSLSLVRVGDRELLIGVTPHTIRTLADLGADLEAGREESVRGGAFRHEPQTGAALCLEGAAGTRPRPLPIPPATYQGLAIRPPRSVRVPDLLAGPETTRTPTEPFFTPSRASRTAPWLASRTADNAAQENAGSPWTTVFRLQLAGLISAWIAALAHARARLTDRSGRHRLLSRPDRSPSMPTPHAPVAGEAVVPNT